MKRPPKGIASEDLFLFKNRPHGKAVATSVLALATLGIAGLIYALARYTTAPLWSILPAPLLGLFILYWYFLAFDSFLFFKEETLELWAGNSTTGRRRCLGAIGSYFEVSYLPHTHEVKLHKMSGTRYVKLQEGERFIKRFQELLEKVVAKEEETSKTSRPKAK